MADYTQPDYVEQRVRYFDGQFLREQDFIDEQRYHLDRGRRLTRLTTSPGVLDGLAVSAVANAAKVTVAAGTAIDGVGRQLVRAADDGPVDLAGFVQRDGPVPVLVALTYRDVEDGALPGGGSPRFRESPEPVAFAEGGADAPPATTHVRLARVIVDPAGTVTVDAAFKPARGGLAVGGGISVGGAGEFGDGVHGGGGAPLRVDGALQVRGPRDFDATTRVDLLNGSADFGRTNLVLTGRVQDGNDAWNFGSGARNSVVFASNAAESGQNVGAVGQEQQSIQLEGNSSALGFLTRQRGTDPAMVITQGGSVGVGTASPDPQTHLDVDGDAVVRHAFASREIGRWTAGIVGNQLSITILPGSAHNFVVVRRSSGLLGNFFRVDVPDGTAGQWFGRYALFDPTINVLTDQMVLPAGGNEMIGSISTVSMIGGASPRVLILEVHQVTVVNG
jgi:hypothetical protein